MRIDGKISIGQAIMLIMLTVGITNHVTVLPLLLSKAGRDAWLTVLITGIPFLGWVCMLSFINRRLAPGESLHGWIRRTTGRFGSFLLLGLLVFCLYLMAITHLIDTQTWTTVNYLPRTPEWFTALVLIIVCTVAASGGIGPLGITSGILLPFVTILGFFVATGNIPKKDYGLLLPLFQNGVKPVLEGMVYAGGAFSELTILLLLQHHIRKPLRITHYVMMLLIAIILTLGPLTGAIAEFGPIEATRQRFPAFEQWRLLTIGKDIENMEFFAIYQWLCGSFTRISLCLLLIAEILPLQTAKQRRILLACLAASMLAIDATPFSDIMFVTFLAKVYYPFYLIIALFLTFTFACLALRYRSKEEETRHGS